MFIVLTMFGGESDPDVSVRVRTSDILMYGEEVEYHKATGRTTIMVDKRAAPAPVMCVTETPTQIDFLLLQAARHDPTAPLGEIVIETVVIQAAPRLAS